MSKILVTADLHIRDVAKYSKYKNHRLDQFIQLAEHMNLCIKENGISHVIIAGDILDNTKPSPIVYHTLYTFIETLVQGCEDCQILICSGNHDADTRFQLLEDRTYYPLLSKTYKYVHYLHNKKIDIGGKSFYFAGWEPDFNPKIPLCDVYVGHYCLPTSVNRQGFAFPGEVHHFNSVQELVILGDIHRHQIINGKILIPGTPLQNSFSDDPNTGYCIIDTDNLSNIERISTADEEWLLKFLYDTDLDVSSYKKAWEASKSEQKFDEWLFQEHNIVFKEKLSSDKKAMLKVDTMSAINLNEILELLVKDFKYKDELYVALGQNQAIISSFINQELKVNLRQLKVSNFKSIESLELDFDRLETLSVITGKNGAGKTTFMDAVIWALTGNSPTKKDEDDVIQIGQSFCEVYLVLEYCGSIIEIERSRGSKFKFKVLQDKNPIEASSKGELQKKLEEVLPAINKLHLLYFNQARDGLLSELNDNARVSLISELSGQTAVAELSDNVNAYVEKLKTMSEKDEGELISLSSKLEGLKSVYKEVENPSEEIQRVKDEIQNLNTKVVEIKEKKQQIERDMTEQYDLQNSTITAKLDQSKERVFLLQQKIKETQQEISHYTHVANRTTEWTCDFCKSVIRSEDITQEEIEEAKEKVAELTGLKMTRETTLADWRAIISKTEQTLLDGRNTLRKEIEESCFNLNTEQIGIAEHLMAKREVLESLMTKLGEYKRGQEIKDTIAKLESEVREVVTVATKSKDKYTEFKKISKSVFGESGLLVAAVLDKLAQTINEDEDFQIVTTKTQKNGIIKPTLDILMRENGKFKPYRCLSGGERLFADLYLISKIIELVHGVGWLMFDETFKYFDTYYSKKAFEKLASLPAQHIFLIYHPEDGVPPELDGWTHIQVARKAGNSVYNLTTH